MVKRKKTLGQIAYETIYPDHWETSPHQKQWERAAAAVEREVLRRINSEGLKALEAEFIEQHGASALARFKARKAKGKP